MSFLKSLKSRKARRPVPLHLEQLSERIVPALTGDDLWWKPVGGSTAWSTAGNWYDSTTASTASAAPGANDIVHFGTSSGTNSNCAMSAGTSVGAIRADSSYTANFTIKGELDVGANDTSGSAGSYWDGGNIFFKASGAGIEELDIFTPQNGTTNGFVFNGGSVGDTKDYSSTSTDTGLVTTTSGSQMSFKMFYGNVYWGADLTNASGGEVKFLSGGSGMVQWVTDATYTPAQIDNFGTWDFVASDSSNSNSGIAVSQSNVNGSYFTNWNTVNFRNSTGNYHEDLPFLNGGSTTAGIVNIYDNVTVVLPNTYTDATYSSTCFYQDTASGSQVNIYCGQINVGGNYVQWGGTLMYSNQSGKTNHCAIASIGASPFRLYGQGGYIYGDVSGGSTTFDLTGMWLVLGNDSGSNVQVQFDAKTAGAGTWSNIVCYNLNLSASNIVMNINEVAGTSAPTGHNFNLLTYQNAFGGTGSFTPSATGTWTGWFAGTPNGQGHWDNLGAGPDWQVSW